MDRELKKEFEKVNLELKETKQEVKIGTIDSVFVSLVILSLSIILTANLSGLTNILSKFGNFGPYILVLIVYSSILIPFILYSLVQYPLSIFFDKDRFTIKINVLAFLGGSFTFLGFILIILFIFFIIEQILKLPLSSPIPEIVLILVLIFTIFSTWKYTLPRIRQYFLFNFPTLLFLRIKKMDSNRKKKALKTLNISYAKLKSLAGYS